MDNSYNRELYDYFTESVLQDSFVTNATVFIASKDVGSESMYSDYGDSLDGSIVTTLKKVYPDGLSPWYRIKVYPLVSNGLRIREGREVEYYAGGKKIDYDVWLSCYEKDVRVRDDSILFDFADYIAFHGDKFIVRGLVRENFGYKPVVHVFLQRKTVDA